MAFVPGFEHDVFVSYAHIDNERGGWVSKLVKELEVRVARVPQTQGKRVSSMES